MHYVYVWHEPAPITADEARTKATERAYGHEAGVFHDHPAVAAFREALLHRYPALEDFNDDETGIIGVWNFTPESSNAALEISIIRSWAKEVDAVIRELAAEHGLVCYEPTEHAVRPNAPQA